MSLKKKKPQKDNLLLLLGTILFCELAGIIGAIFTTPAIPTWYQSLNKPSFNPPAWVFGPVWTLLYFLMGISLYLVLNSSVKSHFKKIGLNFFYLQLFLNILWSLIFFGFKMPFVAFIEIIFLWLSIFFTIYYFVKTTKLAAYLLIPYLLWVTFASFLNLAIAMLN